MSAPAPTLQTRVLHHLGSACLTIDVLAEDLDVPRHALSMAASALIRKGLVERVERGCFQLSAEGSQAAASGLEITSGPNGPMAAQRQPMRNTLRQRAWTVMRMSRKFSIPDLLIPSVMGEEKNPQNNLQRYCKGLCNAGILRRLSRVQKGTAHGSNGFPVYLLARDLGPIAPTLRPQSRSIFDHNAQEELAHV